MKPIEASSCCTPQDTAARAAKAMRESNCGCTPVVENKENLNLVGVVTERDICHSVVAEDLKAAAVRCSESIRTVARNTSLFVGRHGRSDPAADSHSAWREGPLYSTSAGGHVYGALQSPKTLRVFTVEEGAEEHCQMGNMLHQVLFDWLDATLA